MRSCDKNFEQLQKVGIFSTGAVFEEVEAAYDMLKAKGYHPMVYTFPTVKPIDKETIEQAAQNMEVIVTCEEHNIIGGFGGAVAEVMAEMKERSARLLRIGLKDAYAIRVGDQKYLRQQYGMDGESICRCIQEALT